MNVRVLSHSRREGLFAGFELKSVVIKSDKDGVREVYGEGATAKEVFKVTAPFTARAFPATLGIYSLRLAENKKLQKRSTDAASKRGLLLL